MPLAIHAAISLTGVEPGAFSFVVLTYLSWFQEQRNTYTPVVI